MTAQQVRVDGVDIAYTDTGSGPTILFVHGVTSPAPCGTTP
jgi:pimeloyl-ACP methyl ester carboxylesterase